MNRTTSTQPPEEPQAAVERPRRASAAGWLVAVVVAVVAAVAVVQWLQLEARADDRAEAAQVAGTVITALTNWEAASLAEVRSQIDGLATDRFREEARSLLGDVGQGLSQAEARSTGEILDLAVEVHGEADPSVEASRTAAALGVVRQEIANVGLQAPRTDCWGVRAVLKHVEGRWLVDALELYGPNACPEGTS